MEALDAIELVRSAIAGASTLDEMLCATLDSILEVFDCERAWLFAPHSNADMEISPRMERTRPDYPGMMALGAKLPLDSEARVLLSTLATEAPVALSRERGVGGPLRAQWVEFSVQSQLVMGLRPFGNKPWLLGIQHCVDSKTYSGAKRLFQLIGRTIGDGIAALTATQELRQSEERFRTLVERAPEAIVIFDVKRGLFADANPNAELLFGLSREELCQIGPLDMSPAKQSSGADSAEAVVTYIEAALKGAFPIFEWDHRNSSGEAIRCEVRLARLPHPTRSLVRGSITDISGRLRADEEKRELQEHLHQSQKMEAIGNLTGGVAHDFNNLLTVIMGNADLVALNIENPTFVANQVAQIRAAAKRGSSLTHRLLAFARRQPLCPTNIHAGELLVGMTELLERTLGETIRVEMTFSPKLWRCEVDPAQLENAVLNLAINARDAMPEGGTLGIVASNVSEIAAGNNEERLAGEFVSIVVRDNGLGMTDAILAQVFAPFFTTKDIGKGSGLGLSTIYGFARQSGGHVRATSTPGLGTTMSIYVPRATGDTPSPPPGLDRTDVRRGDGERILVVEDEEGVRKTTCALLQSLGYQTLEAPTAVDALDILDEASEVDLLLTDVVLAGGMDGAELVSLATRIRPTLAVLFMSGYSENVITRGPSSHRIRLMTKPFSKRDIASHVSSALAASNDRNDKRDAE